MASSVRGITAPRVPLFTSAACRACTASSPTLALAFPPHQCASNVAFRGQHIAAHASAPGANPVPRHHSSFTTTRTAQELSLLDEATVVNLHQPSDEFASLCSHQLAILSRLLTPTTGACLSRHLTTADHEPSTTDASDQTHLRSAIYVRTAASLENGNLHLIRVAMQGPAAPQATGRAAAESSFPAGEDALLILGAGGVHGQVSDAAAEHSLVSQEVLVLPDSGAVVVPLKHDSLLVGLLVLERGGPLQSPSWVPTDQGHSGRSVDVSMDENDAVEDAPTPWGAGGVLTTEAQWQAVRDVAASLSSACTLEQRATLELAYHMAGRSSLQGLVAEVSQPLRTLRTLGALLAPRVGDEAGNRDMVEGIMAQGDRLQQVASQLQAALHPWGTQEPRAASPLDAGPGGVRAMRRPAATLLTRRVKDVQ